MEKQVNTILQVEHLKKYFYSPRKLFSRSTQGRVVKAVDDVSFSIAQGETFGVVGESGCGKSTLGRSIIRLTEPTQGRVLYDGVDLRSLSDEQMREKRREIQIIFQDPYASLNPRMTVRELIKAPLDVFSTDSDAQKMERVLEIMQLVGLDKEYLLRYPHEFSGGQRQRIVIARALILDPRFVFCDEPVSALDASVRAQVLNLMKRIQRDMNLTYLFISHDLGVVRFLCDRVAVMYLGSIVELAKKEDLYEHAAHPYTQALLSSIPVPDTDVKFKRIILKGEIPSPYDPPSGCTFHTRCSYSMKRCELEKPDLGEIGNGHYVACHLFKTKTDA